MPERLTAFRTFREQMNRRILAQDHAGINRFFALDTRAYESGALDERTKEFCGLVGSLVLRCDDCIAYHVIRCKELGASDEQIWEAFNVGLIVGGSIVIPHLRRAVALLDELRDGQVPTESSASGTTGSGTTGSGTTGTGTTASGPTTPGPATPGQAASTPD